MTTRERQLLALCKEMLGEFGRIWMVYHGQAAVECCFAARRYRSSLDRLTKRKGKK